MKGKIYKQKQKQTRKSSYELGVIDDVQNTSKNNPRNYPHIYSNSYTIEEGDFVSFTDNRTGETKYFHSSNCEIKEVKE